MQGTVERLRPYGAFVRLECGIMGLLHISQISSGRVKAVGQVFKTGDQVKAMVLSVDPSDGHVATRRRSLSAPKGTC